MPKPQVEQSVMGEFDIKDRGRGNSCLLCASCQRRKHPTLTSLFLSRRAWGGAEVEWSDTSTCEACGFAFHGRGLSESEVEAYYKDYRDENVLSASETFASRFTRAPSTTT